MEYKAWAGGKSDLVRDGMNAALMKSCEPLHLHYWQTLIRT